MSVYEKKLISFVTKGEGTFQAKAFCDSYYKTDTGLHRKVGADCTRWSIGYGTKSYRGEVITIEEAEARRDADILRRNSLITSNCLTNNQKIAVVDFIYQHGNNSSNIRYNANNCNIKDIYWTIFNWRDHYKNKKQYGMVKREQLRINLYNI